MIAVEGRLQTRTWDGQDGKRQYATEVVVENAYFTGSRAESNTRGSQGGSYQSNFSANTGFQPPVQQAQQAPQQDMGFVDLDFADDDGSEDDLPF